ncbi:hypothetical protein HY629_00125 [Candidatus Uhrbacteria bacterium]|nr:hypothetical protein [Candidatus Uhrbacteria bacterium]
MFRRQKSTRARYGGNPLYQAEPAPWVTRRFIIDCIALVVVLGAWATTLVVAPYFRIEIVEAPSLLFVSEEETRTAIQRVLHERILGIVPRSSFWTLQPSWLEGRLSREFPFAHFAVTKIYPNMLAVRLREPIVLVDWVTGAGSEYYVDQSGRVVYSVPAPIPLTFAVTAVATNATSTPREAPRKALPSSFLKTRPVLFPLVFDATAADAAVGAVVASPANVRLWQTLQGEFSRLLGVTLATIDVGYRPDHLRLVTEEGWAVFWNEEDDTDVQLQRLAAVFRQKVRDARPQLEYVDLRFGDKVYFKKRP